MFSRLFRRKLRVNRLETARIPDGIRVYCIGDVHGRADLLAAMHEGIRSDLAINPFDGRLIVVYLGDYVDRGLQSRDVIDMLLSDPFPAFEKVYLKGNHDDSVLQFLKDPEFGPIWSTYGGDATLLSYGVRMPANKAGQDRFEDMRQQFARSLPPTHEQFLDSLLLSFELGDYLFVHAGVKPGVPLDRQQPHDLMWIREQFLESAEDLGWVVVHGHSVVPAPEVKANRIGIDTGAYASDVLTCLILENDQRHFMATEKSAAAGAAPAILQTR